MPDVLSRLAAANGSDESFHSSRSSPEEPIKQKASDVHTAALQAAGLPVFDVDDYLNDPRNQLLLEKPTNSKKGKSSNSTKDTLPGSGSSVPEPVPLGGPKTSYRVKLLNEFCQSNGLEVGYNIEGDQMRLFGGSVSINGETAGSTRRWPNKKEAKEGLAEQGIELARRKAAEKRPVASAATGTQVNWAGKLQEYFAATSPTQGPTYTDYGVGKLFACTCTIPNSEIVFGGTSNTFPSKKAAHANAAREAFQSLIEAGLVEPDGSLKAKKKAKVGTAVKIENQGIGVRKNTTYAQKANDLYPILGVTAPNYQLNPVSPSAPNIYSGAATISSPFFPKPLGEIRNVYGRKNAKEECAKGVYEALCGLARSRDIRLDEVEDD